MGQLLVSTMKCLRCMKNWTFTNMLGRSVLSGQDRSTLLKLYNGGSWSRTFRNVSARVPITAFNMSGFIQPGLLLDQLQKSDIDGFNDRQLFDCPAEIDPLYEQLSSLSSDTISFKMILEKIKHVHVSQDMHVYTLNDSGMSVFTCFHDEIVFRRQQVPVDENRRGVLSKAKGQLARIALILHCLEQAIQQLNYEHQSQDAFQTQWSHIIDGETVQRAVVLINHFIQQKFTLMPPEENLTDPELSSLNQQQRDFLQSNSFWVKKVLLSHHQNLTPSLVSQLRLMPPTPTHAGTTFSPGKTRYPASEAKRFLSNISDLGLGTMLTERVQRMSVKGPILAKSSTKFQKRKFSELEPAAHSVLKHLKVSEEEFTTHISNTAAAASSASDEESDIIQPIN